MKRLLVLIMATGLLFPIGVWANKETTTADSHDKIPMASDTLSVRLSANLQSRHIWRGNLTCSSWNIQPSFSISKKNFLVGLWGAQTVDNSYTEVDLYASYTFRGFSISVYDYFCPSEKLRFNRLFDFNRQTTQHTLDVELNFGGDEHIPFWLSVSTLVWGDDNHETSGKKYYSTYLEAGYRWIANKTWEYEFLVGATPFEGYYAPSANVVNLGCGISHNLRLGKGFHFPVFLKIFVNPYQENLFLVFGTTIRN